MKFSVATPVLNGIGFICRCVGSVRGQASTVEHIVRDGGSTDGTVEWLGTQDNLIWTSGPDSGMYEAIHQAWGDATGDVLSWLNVDEQYLPSALAEVEQAFEKWPDVDVIFGDIIVVDNNGSPLAARREIPLRHIYVRNGVLYGSSCGMFFRRRLLERGLLRLDFTLMASADMQLVLDLMRKGARFRHIDRYLGLFTLNENNLSLRQDALAESELVRRRNGAMPLRALRKLVLTSRRLEKLGRGKYLPNRVSFEFASDEVPNYRMIGPTWVWSRFPQSSK